MGIDENRNGAYLEVEIGGRKQGFPLSSDRICRIGRSDDNTIVLDNDSVSRNHALLQALPGGAFLIVDLGSRNGTFVNGRRLVAAAVLRNADHITIGKIEITFNQAGQNDNLEAALASSGTTDVNFDRKLITVLVVDVRGYTVLAQQLDTDKLSQVAGALFRGAGKLLQESGAWTQKYIGDAVMAVWLHRDDGSELGREALSVLEGALQIVDVVSGLQCQFGLDAPIRIGCGLNSGWALVGNVGSIAASDYTAMGDVVNKAFRLESATKEAGYDISIGMETMDFLRTSGRFGSLFRKCSVKLKGYDQPVAAWGANFAELR